MQDIIPCINHSQKASAAQLQAHLSIVLASALGTEDQTSRKRGTDVQLLGCSVGPELVAIGRGAAGAGKSCDTIRALVDQIDQGGRRPCDTAECQYGNHESLVGHGRQMLDVKGGLLLRS